MAKILYMYILQREVRYNAILLDRIPNKSERHLKKCSNFKTMHPEAYDEFLRSDGIINNLNGMK